MYHVQYFACSYWISLCFSGPSAPTPPGASFNFDTGNAPADLLIPVSTPLLAQAIDFSDASLILRVTTLTNIGWFDPLAPYHPTAVGIYSRIPRRPPTEHTNRNRNIAIFYSVCRVFVNLFPQFEENCAQLLQSVGLDLTDDSMDLTTPVGIGNYAGANIVAQMVHDGMNQLGNNINPSLTERTDQGRPFWDYTGYEPVNTAYRLTNAGHWQPSIVDTGSGIFRVQQFVTPQWALTIPFTYSDPLEFSAPLPTASDPNNAAEYRAQADAVLRASADMTDEQKMMAEHFNDKIRSLARAIQFVTTQRNMTLEEFVFYDTALNIAEFDTGIAIWAQKRQHDAVRPFSAIRFLYGNDPITAWGGPGRGTQSIPASQWRSYIPVADHPEYPSASAAFCAAHAEIASLLLSSDELHLFIPTMQGSSTVEPGVTPRTNITIGWNTFTEFSDDCGSSRFWSGVHFPDSIPAGQAIGRAVARRAYDFIMNHINGTPP